MLCKISFEHDPQAINRPLLDEVPGPRPRDLPDPIHERPSTMKRHARKLLHEAARLADASTLGDGDIARIERLRGDAHRLLQRRMQKLMDLEGAVSHPATHHTKPAWGAQPGELLTFFPRALRRTLLELDVSQKMADQLVDTDRGVVLAGPWAQKGDRIRSWQEKGKGKR